MNKADVISFHTAGCITLKWYGWAIWKVYNLKISKAHILADTR